MADATIALASSCRLMDAPSRPSAHNFPSTKDGKVLRSQHMIDPLDVTAVAPYQSMPVSGPLITHHCAKSSALPVVEPNPDMTAEVSNIML